VIQEGNRITPEAGETMAYLDRRGTCTFCHRSLRVAHVGHPVDTPWPYAPDVRIRFLLVDDVPEPPASYVLAHTCQ
jgi:hypothetical protein